MDKTNLGLVQHAEKALKEKWYYGWGSYGQRATASLVNSLVNQYPSMNAQWKSYMLNAVSANTRLCDCYGLVKSYLWWQDDGLNPKYNQLQDRNTTMAFNSAVEKGPLNMLPEQPGIILWMTGHVGVYCGKGRFIELVGGVGARAGTIENKKIISGSKFTHWFLDTYINYSGHTGDDELVDTTKVLYEGNEIEVERIFKNDVNYIKLREMEKLGFKIDYDINKGLPVIERNNK